MTKGLIKLTQEMIVIATFNSSLYKLRNDWKTFECPMNISLERWNIWLYAIGLIFENRI